MLYFTLSHTHTHTHDQISLQRRRKKKKFLITHQQTGVCTRDVTPTEVTRHLSKSPSQRRALVLRQWNRPIDGCLPRHFHNSIRHKQTTAKRINNITEGFFSFFSGRKAWTICDVLFWQTLRDVSIILLVGAAKVSWNEEARFDRRRLLSSLPPPARFRCHPV